MAEQRATFLPQLGKVLHIHYSSVVEDPMPEQWVELISALKERDRLDKHQHAIDEDLHERKLLVADRHIVDGERRVSEQRIRISRFRKSGLDTWDAEWLLHQFEVIVREMFRHRAMLIHHRAIIIQPICDGR